jgi:hypothetical protein
LALKQKDVKQMGVKQGLGAMDWEVLCQLFIRSVLCFVAMEVLHIDFRGAQIAGAVQHG